MWWQRARKLAHHWIPSPLRVCQGLENLTLLLPQGSIDQVCNGSRVALTNEDLKQMFVSGKKRH